MSESKQSTRVCPKCGCNAMSELHGLDKKICTGCGHEVDWPLEPGQKSIFKKNVIGGCRPGEMAVIAANTTGKSIAYLSGESAAWH